ncbi:hypothetical protein OH460_08290 [Vibrio sp. Makdt]|uniref:hypothetical protein n=1 Tax=Vibrio sp. Makdt TaxID=2998828 RepID=UPI0022CD8F29|nr:hypothetical protein [Vibrio sp. Makdt]MDA0152298.1 hypothetical protein [Vibrio sp. Makdt]
MKKPHIIAFVILTVLAYTILSSGGWMNGKLAAYSLYANALASVVIAAVNTYVFRNVINTQSK